MILNPNINYIVSGLERSGTSMLMQIINAGGVDTSFDDSRKPDKNNPKGYFELSGGKIINQLMDGKFSFEKHRGKFIKITCYGLKFLPKGKYKIIYSERNIEEILDSMEKMMGKKDPKRNETKDVFIKLNKMVKNKIKNRSDCDVLFVNYNKIIKSPYDNIKKIYDFLDNKKLDLEKMVSVVDKSLYRQRHN